MPRPLFVVVIVLLPLGSTAAPVPKDKLKVKDDEAIVGTWGIDKFDAGEEKPPPAELLATIRFVFAEKGAFQMAGGPTNDKQEGTFKLDPDAKIKTLDVTFDGKTMKALYELDGDALTLCLANGPDSPRPTEMKADGKARVALVTFKRVKADEKKDK